MILQVNFLPVLASAVMATIIGALWYSPLLFGKAWLKGYPQGMFLFNPVQLSTASKNMPFLFRGMRNKI